MPEQEVDWGTFTRNFKPAQCRVEGEKLVCEGTLDDTPAVCEVTQVDGKHQVSCRKYVENAVPV